MNADAQRNCQGVTGDSPHPNDVDRKRIERALAGRARYRYVTPTVRAVAGGYRIESPCCSRNIDADGGTIDIAWIEFLAASQCWRLYRRNHDLAVWEPHAEYISLAMLLDELNHDSRRVFWQ
jgi:hypothetical protein